jgi:hypothetical protein
MFLHLSLLKKRILPPELAEETRYDERLEAMASGIARAFESQCGRLFSRVEDQVEEMPGGNTLYSVARYPLEEVGAVDVRIGLTGSWDSYLDEIAHLSKSSGQILMDAPPCTEFDTVRFTYTGGYHIDLTEDLSDSAPEGAAALPADLIDAWCLQCDHEARLRKIFGGTSDADLSAPFDMEASLFIPRVDAVLRRYTRMA